MIFKNLVITALKRKKKGIKEKYFKLNSLSKSSKKKAFPLNFFLFNIHQMTNIEINSNILSVY